MTNGRWALIFGLALALAFPVRLLAQQGAGDVIYVPTPQVIVDEMLTMAKVGPNDVLIDLGSGDGRVVLTAVKKFNAARGLGVELDKVLLKQSNDAAAAQGIAARAKFLEQDLFTTDLSQFTVITSYLLPSMNEKLLPKVLNLKPGTRVVAHDYGFGSWPPVATKTIPVPEKKVGNPGVSYVYLYVVPAKVAGHWQSQATGGTASENWDFDLTQHFQEVEGTAKSPGQLAIIASSEVNADKVDFVVFTKAGDNSTRREFAGTVRGDAITGTLTIGAGSTARQLNWTAKLTQRTATSP